MTATVKIKDRATPIMQKQLEELKGIMKKAYRVFLDHTPKRTGNAKRKTKLVNEDKIQANYPYAGALDEGRSKQSPEGMSKPTADFIKKEFKRIMR